jgi:hypothetical protein
MYTIKNFITALQILEKYSNDEVKPFYLGGVDLFITNVDSREVTSEDKEILLTLGFNEFDNHFYTKKYTFIYE